jgi:hypothetical protein
VELRSGDEQVTRDPRTKGFSDAKWIPQVHDEKVEASGGWNSTSGGGRSVSTGEAHVKEYATVAKTSTRNATPIELIGIGRFKFNEGKLEEFKRLSHQAVEIVQSTGPGHWSTTSTSMTISPSASLSSGTRTPLR